MRRRDEHRLSCGPMLMLAIVLACGIAQAQSPATPPPAGSGAGFHRGGPGPLPDDAIGFLRVQGGIGAKTITGAPFSATFSQQSTQTLGDGNHIQQMTTGTFSRDSQGRTRRDMSLPAIGPLASASGAPPHVILINDPVNAVHYILEPDQRIARKVPAPPRPNGNGGSFNPSGQKNRSNVTTMSLGTQVQDGLTLQGTRTTRTIPAGAIGNDEPIQVVVDRWYSPDLQVNVIIKRTDPRMGDSIFQLTNIQRQEPDASAFQVPSDYTVKEGGRVFAKGSPPTN